MFLQLDNGKLLNLHYLDNVYLEGNTVKYILINEELIIESYESQAEASERYGNVIKIIKDGGEGYKPTGEIDINENGVYDVTAFASANVNVPMPDFNLQSRSVTIAENGITTIEPDQGYDGLSNVDVTVEGVLDTSDATAIPLNIKSGQTAYVKGEKITGTLPVLTYPIDPIDPSNWDYQFIRADGSLKNVTRDGVDYITGGHTVVSNTVESWMFEGNSKMKMGFSHAKIASVAGLSANKLKKGETVLGVTGTYEGPEPVQEKDVNFYDYDGTVIDSYTANEFANLSLFPANPTHAGLTSQGWNWTLADAKTYVATYGKLNIGQMYITDDGATRIYIKLEEGRLAPYLGFAIDGTAIVDWGDNTTSTVTGTDTTTAIFTQHTYASAGEYVISISSTDNIYLMGNSSYTSSLLVYNTLASANDRIYSYSITKVELGNGVSIEANSFYNCINLATITMPNDVIGIGNNAFRYCLNLLSITIPKNGVATSIGDNAFKYGISLKSVCIPNTITDIKQYAFQYCRGKLLTITIPDSVINIDNYAFSYCEPVKRIIIPNSIASSINIKSFEGCYSIENEITLNASSIQQQAFSSCCSLSIIHFNNTTNIAANVFSGCFSMRCYDFTSLTSIPILNNTNAFTGIPSDCKIVVPDSLYEDWIVANNWSTYASHIVKESDWT